MSCHRFDESIEGAQERHLIFDRADQYGQLLYMYVFIAWGYETG